MRALQSFAGLQGSLALPVLIYLAAVMLPITFQVGSLFITSVRLVLIVLILPLSAQLFMGRYGRVLLTDMMFFVHFLWIIVALAINNPAQVIQNAGSTGIEFIGGYVLARAYIRTPDDFAALIRTLAVIALCTFPFALYETATGQAIILKVLAALPGISSLRDIEIGRRMGLYRVQLVFAHPIHYGLFCTVALSLCFVGLKGIYGNTRRVLVAGVVGVSGLLALSSGALLAIVLQIMLIGWAWLFRNSVKRWLFLLGLFALMYMAISVLSNRPPMRVFMSYATFSAHTAYMRSIIFDWGMINVWAHPIFGLGLNEWVRASYMRSSTVDNFWLLTAMRYGIVGFGFLAVGYLVALWRIGQRDFESDPILWQFRRAWMFSFVGLTFTLCTVHIWHTIFSFVFFMFGAGMWMLTVPSQARAVQTTPAPRGGGPQNVGRDLAAVPKRGATLQRQTAAALPQTAPEPAPGSAVDANSPRSSALRYTRFPPKDTSR